MKILADNKPINPLRIVIVLVILVLLTVIAFLGLKYIKAQGELQADEEILKMRQINEKILDFTKLFISDVLRSKNEINFETRLKIENAVRNIGDEDILTQWQKFVGSKTENEAQEEVKNLLDLLVEKIKIQ